MRSRIKPGGPFFVDALEGEVPPTGTVAAAEYRWGTHAETLFNSESLKSHVWASAVAVTATALATFITASPQTQAAIQPAIWESVNAGQPKPLINQLRAAPQYDLTPQGSIWEPASAALTSNVPALTFGSPAPVDLTVQGWIRSSATSVQAVPALTLGAPGLVDLTTQGWIKKAALGVEGTIVQQFVGGPPALDLTQQGNIWEPTSAPIVLNAVPALISGAPAPVDLTIQGWIRRAVAGIQGPTVWQFSSGPAPIDLAWRSSIWRPTSSAIIAAVPPMIVGAPALIDLTQQGWIKRPTPNTQGVTVWQFVVKPLQGDIARQGSIWSAALAPITQAQVSAFVVGAPPLIETQTQAWVWRPAFGVQGKIIASLVGGPPAIDLNLQGNIWKPAATAPVQGAVPRSIWTGEFQVDWTQQGGRVWTPFAAPAAIGEKQELLSYIPEPLYGEDLRTFMAFVLRELARISRAVEESRRYIEYRTKEPDKPKTGVFYLADGVGWNPGGGKGVYAWFNNQWNKL